MHLNKLLATVSSIGVISGAGAQRETKEDDPYSSFGPNLISSENYNAPPPPWDSRAKPGWYYRIRPFAFPDIPYVNGKKPRPPTNDGYFQTFKNLKGATQADDYLTFGLVDTEADCKVMCDNVAGCNFVNTYHDVNGKGGSTQLTCSLFSKCHDASTADNRGGQSQPNGSVDYITSSDGFCKNGHKVGDRTG